MADNGYLMVGGAFAFLGPVFSNGVLPEMAGSLKGAKIVNAIPDDPKKGKQLITKNDPEIRMALKIFSWFIF